MAAAAPDGWLIPTQPRPGRARSISANSHSAAASGLSGPRVYRMHSRWLNPNRIYSTDQSILTSPASSIGVCFQTCIPVRPGDVASRATRHSFSRFSKRVEQAGALGIMVRFTAYVNLYFMNGIFNNIEAQPRNYEELASALAAAWDALERRTATPPSSSPIPATATLSAWSASGMTAN